MGHLILFLSVRGDRSKMFCLSDILERICIQDTRISKQETQSVIGSDLLTVVSMKSYSLWDISFARFLLISYSSTLKMEVLLSFETSVDFHRTTWRYAPKDGVLQIGLLVKL
jgi:hypothetical protein